MKRLKEKKKSEKVKAHKWINTWIDTINSFTLALLSPHDESQIPKNGCDIYPEDWHRIDQKHNAAWHGYPKKSERLERQGT